MKVNKHNNGARKRVSDKTSSPQDTVPIHVPAPRWWREKFQTKASAHPVHGSMAGVIRALADAWMSGDIKL